MVPGRSISPRVQVTSFGSPSAFSRFHRSRVAAQTGSRRFPGGRSRTKLNHVKSSSHRMSSRSGTTQVTTRAVRIGDVTLGGGAPLVLIAGPCVIENENHTMFMARELFRITQQLQVPLIFKASFDKANRTSAKSSKRFVLKSAAQSLPTYTRRGRSRPSPGWSTCFKFQPFSAAKPTSLRQSPCPVNP